MFLTFPAKTGGWLPAFWLTFSLVFVPRQGVLLTAYSRIFDNAGPLFRYRTMITTVRSSCSRAPHERPPRSLPSPRFPCSPANGESVLTHFASSPIFPGPGFRQQRSGGTPCSSPFRPRSYMDHSFSIESSFYGNARMENLFTPLRGNRLLFRHRRLSDGFSRASFPAKSLLCRAAFRARFITALFGVILAFAVVPCSCNIAPGQIEETAT